MIYFWDNFKEALVGEVIGYNKSEPLLKSTNVDIRDIEACLERHPDKLVKTGTLLHENCNR